ncbi:lysozyme [Caballeronia calidae]|uniref:Lysozyme n=1 Tax=Caballeronia calidae TaxID=1777139 RepID=A0A158EI50_9BURK|nr:M15 family metallopeptidase [Caballeronia calidae]SAL06494.1 lysozyme [Caballeronia calidae]
MTLVEQQSTFLLHVAELIRKASELGLKASGGELYRTPEQQILHVKNGRSKTMSSQHLKRLAIDLNFFKPVANGKFELTYDIDELRPLGQYWESLDPANRWGGSWSSFKDTPHFERRDTRAPDPFVIANGNGKANSVTDIPIANGDNCVQAQTAMRGNGLIGGEVGRLCGNVRDDVESVQRLLNLCAAAKNGFAIQNGALKADGIFGSKTFDAIVTFEQTVMAEATPTGRVSPTGEIFKQLCKPLVHATDTDLMALAWLQAADVDITQYAGPIAASMAKYGIDTPLRQAHFLAQIGHESGELRFKEELASGSAYEGREDLGNVQAGDGRLFKGRGFIQLTGRANYTAYARSIGRENDILANPTRVATEPSLCVDVAGWFWSRRQLSALADNDDLIGVTKKINGGLNGIENRRRLLNRAKAVLGV